MPLLSILLPALFVRGFIGAGDMRSQEGYMSKLWWVGNSETRESIENGEPVLSRGCGGHEGFERIEDVRQYLQSIVDRIDEGTTGLWLTVATVDRPQTAVGVADQPGQGRTRVRVGASGTPILSLHLHVPLADVPQDVRHGLELALSRAMAKIEKGAYQEPGEITIRHQPTVDGIVTMAYSFTPRQSV